VALVRADVSEEHVVSIVMVNTPGSPSQRSSVAAFFSC
jgi:hypothetical protein